MSKYVIDPSALMQIFVPDTYTDNVASLLADASDERVELVTAQFGIVECCNVIWQQIKKRGISIDQAELLVNDLLELPITTVITDGLHKRALRISHTHHLAIYDSLYIALAERLGYPLITADAKQTTAALAEGITLKAIADFVPPSA